jgi:DNA-directed RNA polymerase subunit RPC12/RpoP
MPIDIGTTTSLVCPTCKKETGMTRERLLRMAITEDFICPHCGKVVFSCKPVVEKFTYTYNYSGNNWSEYD